MRKESFMWGSKKGHETKASFNKIESWLEELEAVQDTQRMLLRGGSRKLQGSMLRSKSSKGIRKHRHQNNFIEIDNQTKVFKISQFEQSQFLSKTFTPFKKDQKNKQRILTVYSEGVSPRQKSYSNQSAKTLYPSKQREFLKLNTKELLFKMKKIKRVESFSQPKSFQSNKDKISKILNWKAELIEFCNGVETKGSNQYYAKPSLWRNGKIKTSPSTPKDSNIKLNRPLDEELRIKKCSIGQEGDNEDSLKGQRKVKIEVKNDKKVSMKVKKQQKVDPRIKLQLEIAKKLFSLQQNQKHKKR